MMEIMFLEKEKRELEEEFLNFLELQEEPIIF
jgi:hypothetical protein